MNSAWQRAGRCIILAVFVASLGMLYRELSRYDLHDVSRRIMAIPTWRLGAAIGLMVVNYVVLVGYDALALRAIQRSLPWKKIAFGSFTGFVSSYNLGPLLGGSAVRYRLYSSWGLSAVEILQLFAMLGITFWVGVLSLAGVVFLFLPAESLGFTRLSVFAVRGVGASLCLLTATFIGFTYYWKKPIRVRGSDVRLPDGTTTLLQILVSAIDFLITAGCLYVLIDEQIDLNYWQTLAILLLAMITAVLSHVPGGVGVFEVVVLQLAGTGNASELVACLLAFRLIYFLLPLGIAMAMLAFNEIYTHGANVGQWSGELSRWSNMIVPRFLAACTFLSGVMLLFSGATPIRLSRAPLVESWIPLSVVEVSHFLGSMIGASLLLIALGLNRRLDSAWWVSIVLAMSGVVVSVLKGLDFEEAVLMASIAFVLLLCRKSFYRRGQLVNQTLSRDSFYAIALVMLCAGWLAVFSNKNMEYSAHLWWDFSFHGDASRMLRGGVAALCVLMLFAVRRLLIPHSPQPVMPASVQDPQLQSIVRNSPVAASALALLGDKSILFNADETGFVMYSVQGRSWIAMRDPVGARNALPELAWSFRSIADEHAGWPVFYQVGEENLPMYLDQGLTLLKLGEEARVPLVEFTMDGPNRRNLRRTYSRLQRMGCTFEVISSQQVRELLPELRDVSASWLDNKKMSEKGFSLGYFDESYLMNFPCGIVRLNGRVMAFTNLWCSADREEVTSDLMRYRPDSPSHIMEYLLVESLLWSQQHDYHWFSLGMAPLSGISNRPLAPLWNRAAGLVFRHGDQFYNFEGLREFKERFSPVWVPKYLASPGGWLLPRVLADVALLIARRPPQVRTFRSDFPLPTPHLPITVGQL